MARRAWTTHNEIVSSVRLLAFSALVGLVCWLIWPSDSSSSSSSRAASGAAGSAAARASTATAEPTLGSAGGSADSTGDDAAALVRVEGIVIDEQEHAIGGATVRTGTRVTVAEADGSFAFDDMPQGELVLQAERGEWYGEESTTAYEASDPVEITVRRGSTLVLHVVRKADGAPITRAKVEIARRELYTDERGELRTRGLDPTGERFTVSADGYGTWRGELQLDTEHPTATKEMTVALASGASVSGVVVDERGDRVPEAYVTINAVDDSWRDSVTADARGEFTLPAIATGKHTLYGSSNRHVATPEQLVEHDGVHPLTGVVVRVSLGAEVAGRVVDAAGKPVAGATIRGASAETDADGRFLATGLEPGELTLSAQLASRASAEKKVTVAAGKRAEVELVLRESSLAGRVVDSRNTPIVEATLWAKATDDSNTFFATSDDYGKFDFEGIPPGEYRIVAQHDEERYRAIPDDGGIVVRTGRRDLTVVLPALATITGRVVLDGAPVTYFGVAVTKRTTQLTSEHLGTSDENGAFVRSDIAPGTWSVVIVGPEFATKVIPDVVVTEGHTTNLGTITVERGRVIRGLVTDQRGRPIAGALVAIGRSLYTLAGNRLDQRAQGDSTARTDASGRFQISGVPAGELQIVARDGERTSVERALAPEEADVTLEIAEVGTVDGHIHNMRVVQSSVLISPVTEDGSLSDATYRGDVDRAGDFRVKGVPAGTYKVHVYGDNTLAEQTVEVVANQTAHVEFTMPDVQIEVAVHVPGCSVLYLVAPGGHNLEVCAEGDVVTWHAVAPGAYRVCRSYDDGCAAITVGAGPDKQWFEVTLPVSSD